MPTLPSGFTASESHHAREVAESFGTDAERYDRTRPGYPQALADRIVAATPGLDVLDVGIGTGLSARPFRAAGCRVVGVEVDARMAELARRRGFDVDIARFEDWDPAGRTFDAVVAGQTWHWVDPVRGAARAAAVLRPGGRLAAFWNTFGFPPDVAEALAAVYARVFPGSPFAAGMFAGVEAYSGQFARADDGIRATGAFGETEQWRVDWERPYSRDEWLEMVPTAGGLNRLSPETLGELLAGIGDAVGEGFTMSYATVAVTAALRR